MITEFLEDFQQLTTDQLFLFDLCILACAPAFSSFLSDKSTV